MLVVHGIWAYGALQVWAEDSGCPRRPRRGRAAVPGAAPASVRRPAGRAGGRARGRWPASRATWPARRSTTSSRCGCRPRADGPLASPELVRPSGRASRADTSARRRHQRWPPGGCPCLVFEPADRRRALLPALAELAPGDAAWPSGSVGLPRRRRAVRRRPGGARPGAARPAPRKTAATPPAGGRCSPPPTRGTPASSPPRCRPPAARREHDAPRARPAARGHARRAHRCVGARPAAGCPAARAPGSPPRPYRVGRTDACVALTGPDPLIEVADAADEREAGS